MQACLRPYPLSVWCAIFILTRNLANFFVLGGTRQVLRVNFYSLPHW